MSNQAECPICMDSVEFVKNCVTTECGHCFHASCLMKSVAHNGFGCPYCRTAMAEEVEDEASSEWSEVTSEEEMFDDFALRGFRFFMNNIEGVEHDHEDALEEQEDMEEEEETLVAETAKPTPAFIAQKLVEQGVTMEHLLKVILRDHDEYESNDTEFERADDEIFGKLRVIITNYVPQTEQQVEEPVRSSQPNQYTNITVRRPMTHI